MIKVQGLFRSPFVREAFIALNIKWVPYEIVRQMAFAADDADRAWAEWLEEVGGTYVAELAPGRIRPASRDSRRSVP